MEKITLSDRIHLYYDIFLLQLKNRKRNHSTIDKDYNSGVWKKPEDHQFDESWRGNYGTSEKTPRILVQDGKLFKGYWDDTNTKKYYSQLDKVLDQYKDESVVELGCGLGHGVFRLFHKNFREVAGYDVSENAINLLKKHCVEKNYPIKFEIQDLTQTLAPGIIQDKIVYTHACLEQLKNYMPDVIKNIREGKPKLVINFEVNYDSEPFLVKQYFKAKDFQNNLVRILKKLQKQGKVEIISIEKFPFAFSPTNRFSAIIWKNK